MQQNLRLFLWLGLALAIWLNVEAWLKDYGTSATPEAPVSRSTAVSPTAASGLASSVPNTAPAAQAAKPTAAGGRAATLPPAVPRVHVTTDVYEVDISTRGGDLVGASLLQYPLRKDAPEVKVRLFDDRPEPGTYILQTGLTGGSAAPAPNHLATYTAPGALFKLAAVQRELRVRRSWDVVPVMCGTQTYVFSRRS